MKTLKKKNIRFFLKYKSGVLFNKCKEKKNEKS